MACGDAPVPTGTVTMLFTDVEGFDAAAEELGSERRAEALMVHREQIRAGASAHRGVEIGTERDAFFVVIQSAGDGLTAAGEMQVEGLG
jgi:class 3 adenylate cyclase